MPLTQYQRLAEPLPQAGGFNERTTPDKWLPLANLPRWDVKRLQYLAPSGITPDRQQVPDADSWFPLDNQPRFDIKRAQYAYSCFSGPDQQQQPDADGWFPLPNQPRFDLKRIQAIYPAGGFTQSVFAEIVSADRFSPLPNQPRFDIKRTQYTYPFSILPERQPEPHIDGWLQAISQPLFNLKRQQWMYPANFEPQPFPAPVTPLSWQTAIVQPRFDIKRQQWVYPPGGFTQAIFSEIVSVDRFKPLDNQPLFDRKRIQALYPALSFAPQPIVTPVTPLAWQTLIVQPRFDIKRAQWMYPAGGWTQSAVAERSTPDKWWVEASRPVFRKGWLPYIPSAFVPIVVAPGAVVFFGKEIVQPMFPKARAPYTQLAQSFAVAERITPDKWWMEASRPLTAPRTLRPDALSLVPRVTAVTPSLVSNWFQPASIPVRMALDIAALDSTATYFRWEITPPPIPPLPPAPEDHPGPRKPGSLYGHRGWGIGGFGSPIPDYPTPPPQLFTNEFAAQGGGYGDPGYGEGGYGGDGTTESIGGPVMGMADGVNRVFWVGVVLRRAQVWLNRRMLTLEVDVRCVDRYIVFTVAPPVNALIEIQGWPE